MIRLIKAIVAVFYSDVGKYYAMSFLSGHTRAMMVSGEEDVSEE